MRIFIAAVLLILAGATPAWPSLESGMVAYMRRDFKYAFRELGKQGRAGSAKAQILVGRMCEKGEGTAQNFAEAARWYRAAAEQGDGEAQLFLGLMYREGRGVPQDFEEAYHWCALAAQNGIRVAGSCRDEISRYLNRDQINRLRKAAAAERRRIFLR